MVIRWYRDVRRIRLSRRGVLSVIAVITVLYLHVSRDGVRIFLFHRKLSFLHAQSVSKLKNGHSQQKTTMVLILAHYRGGSTFTGEVLNQNKDSIYIFEPLLHIYQQAIPRDMHLSYINGSFRPPLTEKTRRGVAMDTLRSYFECDLTNIDIDTLNHPCMNLGVKSKQFRECGGSSDNICLQNYIEACYNSTIRAIKTVRLRVSDIVDLFGRLLSLKLIYLMRDPRGIIHSRMHVQKSTFLWSTPDEVALCKMMTSNLNDYNSLEKRYPGRVMRLNYENLAENPLAGTREIYNFLGRPLPQNIAQWLRENTASETEEKKGNMNVKKRNSSYAAWNWRRTIPWDIVQSMDKHCFHVYDQAGYKPFKTEEDLRDISSG